jgi:hypothetical protein
MQTTPLLGTLLKVDPKFYILEVLSISVSKVTPALKAAERRLESKNVLSSGSNEPLSLVRDCP